MRGLEDSYCEWSVNVLQNRGKVFTRLARKHTPALRSQWLLRDGAIRAQMGMES